MSHIERPAIRDTARARLSRAGVPAEVEAAIAALSREQLAKRCRTALAELEGVDAPKVILARPVAAALLAACWTLAGAGDLAQEARSLVLEVDATGKPDGSVALDRLPLVRLVGAAVRLVQ